MDQLDIDILRFLDGGMSREEELELVQAIKDHPEGESKLAFLVTLNGQLPAVLSDQKVEKQVESIRKSERNNLKKSVRKPTLRKPQKNKSKVIPFILSAAAAIFFAFGIYRYSKGAQQQYLTVIEFEGKCEYGKKGSLKPVNSNVKINNGQILQITNAGKAVVSFSHDGTTLTLYNSTLIKFNQNEKGLQIILEEGFLEANVKKQDKDYPIRFITSDSEAEVLGTKLRIEKTEKKTALDVLSGSVSFSPDGNDQKAVLVKNRQYSEIKNGTKTKPSVNDYPEGSTGQILWQRWLNIGNIDNVDSLRKLKRFPEKPDKEEYLPRFEFSSNYLDEYGSRITGYLHPPKTGMYNFWISGDYKALLLLSTDETNNNFKKIARSEEWTTLRDYDKYPSQKSAKIRLVAGEKYYIRVLHIEDTQNDSVSVAWEGPGIEREVIPGRFLSPAK